MATWRLRGLILLPLFVLAGCTALPFQLGSRTPLVSPVPQTGTSPAPQTTRATVETSAPLTPQATVSATQPVAGNLVRIWVPPGFDPDGDTPASQLLRTHLDAFVAVHPDVRLEVRVKAVDGPGGLLDALVAANAAAPLTLPDLVLLPRPLLESAALKGLLYPYDHLTSLVDDNGWFEYAHQLAKLKTSTYGMPFAADALVLAYHPSQLPTAPTDLESLLGLGKVLLFPATDEQALFTLSIYLAEGKNLEDAQGRPSLDEGALTRILEFYQRAGLAGVMPYWLTQYSNDAQIWEAFSGGEYAMAATWVSAYLEHKLTAPEDLAMAPLPTLDGAPFNLVTGWSWALAGQDAARRATSVQLAEFMVEKDFLAKWSEAAGSMPPRIDALQSWQQADQRQMVEQISYSAWLMPPADMISSLGPAVEQAVVDVLKSQSDPQSAAHKVIEQVNLP
jgi:multiple sugar transport system substrate-binding protein